jgi:hypothetical protein
MVEFRGGVAHTLMRRYAYLRGLDEIYKKSAYVVTVGTSELPK